MNSEQSVVIRDYKLGYRQIREASVNLVINRTIVVFPMLIMNPCAFHASCFKKRSHNATIGWDHLR